MKPHSLTTIKLSTKKPPSQRYQEAQLERRFGPFVKGAQLPETKALACPRVRVADLPVGYVKQTWIDQQEQNQKIASCCRHPENHDIEAYKSHPSEKAPDIYHLICTCGRRHIKFCVGLDDERPAWEAA